MIEIESIKDVGKIRLARLLFIALEAEYEKLCSHAKESISKK